ncbi:MAG TPA: GNAT family N-acetyltransferase [Firmicutes bacterium]|jgi:ribosomal protein S18 acetylase RimI-like enzyme|nr:N-acetyltransferase [Bacillota bacterium]HHT41818.1 GNAT family N-acetyltransferase [Bacillota bacterium]
MRVVTASQHHAQSIANIYRQAFPESAALFFRRVPETRLIQLLELTFSLLFTMGVQGSLAVDEQGCIAGYCLYSTSSTAETRPSSGDVLRPLGKMAVLAGPWALLKLLVNEVTMALTARRMKKVPKPEATIVSVAVLPGYQGQGVGTLLLSFVLDQLKGQSVGLNVRADNEPGKRLYASAGFEKYGRKRDLSGTWLMMYRKPSP